MAKGVVDKFKFSSYYKMISGYVSSHERYVFGLYLSHAKLITLDTGVPLTIYGDPDNENNRVANV